MSRGLHMAIMLGVLLHMVLGCCLHHAHAQAPAACPGGFREEAPCHHGEGHHERSDHDSHHHRDRCDDGKCTFVVPKTKVGSRLVGPLLRLAAVSPQTVESACGASKARPTSMPLPGSGPPLRLHLVHQVLLV